MTIYRIIFNNYQGQDFTELYREKVNAQTRFHALQEEAESKGEFEKDSDDTFSFFDFEYNQYSTWIAYEERELESLFYD